MLRIKDWGIDADNYCYIVGKIKVRNTKEGRTEEYLANPKYFKTLEEACEAILEAERKNIVKENELAVASLKKSLADMNAEFKELFGGLDGDGNG